MKTVAQTMGELTATLAHATRARPTSTPSSTSEKAAAWLGLQTFGEADLQNLATECLRFLNEVKNGEKPRWLTLCGDSGTGKSHCANRIWQWFVSTGQFYECPLSGARLVRRGSFFHWSKLLSELRRGNWDVRDLVINQWLAVIDDIGTENDRTGFAAEQLYQVLEGRMGKWTVITTNMPLKLIAERVDTRVASRLVRDRNRFVFTTAVDYALRGGAQK